MISEKIAENSHQLSAEEVSDNDSEGIDCDINYTNLSNDETNDGIIGSNIIIIQDVSQHKPRHTADTLECSECARSFDSRRDLIEHKNSHNKKVYTCDFEDCRKSYFSVSTLNSHKKTHDKDCKRHPVKCKWLACQRTFLSKAEMADHMNTHLGIRPYKCDWPDCDKSYPIRSSLRVHKTRHKIHSCVYPECDFKSRSFVKLREHYSHHKNSKK